MSAEWRSHNLAIIIGLRIRNTWTARYAPTQAKLMVLLKLEICMYGQKWAWDNTETPCLSQGKPKEPDVTFSYWRSAEGRKSQKKYVSSLQRNKESKIVYVWVLKLPSYRFF